ncbi:MAG: hypothetical protein ACREC0_15390 [Methylocella sp.]
MAASAPASGSVLQDDFGQAVRQQRRTASDRIVIPWGFIAANLDVETMPFATPRWRGKIRLGEAWSLRAAAVDGGFGFYALARTCHPNG